MNAARAFLLCCLSLIAAGCAIDTPTYSSAFAGSCGSAFSVDGSYQSYFSYSGMLNGTAVYGSAVVTPNTPVNAPATRQIIINSGTFALTINLTSSAYGLRTVGLGNTSVWLSAVTCGNYYSCSSEKYIAGDYSGLRGSGTVNLARSSGVTQITVNATLPHENTSLSQTMQFQNVIFTEACYY